MLNQLLQIVEPLQKKKELMRKFRHVDPTRRFSYHEIAEFLDEQCAGGRYDRAVAKELFDDCCNSAGQATMEEFIEKYIDSRNTLVLETRKELKLREKLIHDYERAIGESEGQSQSRLNVEVKEAFLDKVYGDRAKCYLAIKSEHDVKTTDIKTTTKPIFNEAFQLSLQPAQRLSFVLVDNDVKAGQIYYDYRPLKVGETRKERANFYLNNKPTGCWLSFEVKALQIAGGTANLDGLGEDLNNNERIIDENLSAINALMGFQHEEPLKLQPYQRPRHETWQDRLGNSCIDCCACCGQFTKCFLIFTLVMFLIEGIGTLFYPSFQLVCLSTLLALIITSNVTSLRFKVIMHVLIYSQVYLLVGLAAGSWKLPNFEPVQGHILAFQITKSVLYAPYMFFFWLCAVKYKQFEKEVGFMKASN